MTEKTLLQRKVEIMTADMKGDTVMMDVETGKYYNLGDVGGRIWDLMENPITLSDMADRLTEEYDVTRERCLSEILPFLQSLLERNLIREVG
ncbi:MAG: lasso peptide biosynthesis PqqD family chaperone [Ruminococcaceae bacterium]|nr:lasso peptide biosynthesis PqqD family chaperone [Oscillospiraceae bacterium]